MEIYREKTTAISRKPCFFGFRPLSLFRIFRLDKVFKKNEEHIFVISSNSSIEWCLQKIENKFHGKSAYCAPYEKPMLSFWKPYLRKSSLPPTAHLCFDRSFVALSNVIPHYVQSSLLMEYLGLEHPAIEWVSRDPPSSDGSKNF
jgi:hypothetical protein